MSKFTLYVLLTVSSWFFVVYFVKTVGVGLGWWEW
jgi:hypothetical protein